MREHGRMEGSLTGHHLVAAPHLLDPNFFGTVVFIVEHGAEGALGLVLNRPTREPLQKHLPEWADQASPPADVFVGGPVSNEVAVGIAELPEIVPQGWEPALPGIGLIDLSEGPAARGKVARLRVFSGYSGWAGGQLEDEIETDSWFVVPAHPDDIFTTEPDALRTKVLRRQQGRIAIYAHFPANPKLN
jgi:putative transcriptional regulator